MFDTYLGTTGGVYRLTDAGVEPLGLSSERISALHAWRDGGRRTILAGSYGNGLYRSQDGGTTWSAANEGLTAPALRCIVPDPLRPGALLAGTEPARLFRSRDGGDTWQPASEGIATPMPDMVELFVAAPDASVWAICSGGGLLRAVAGEWFWRSALPADADLRVQSITFAS